MKKEALVALLIVVILASTLTVYYLESNPGSDSSWGTPSLVYDFNSTILRNYLTDQYYGGSFLGWNTSGYITNNETYAITIHPSGSLSRQFKAMSSKVGLSFDWSIGTTLVVNRQVSGVYQDLTNFYTRTEDLMSHTNQTSFDVDNNTAFTVQFESYNYLIGELYRVKLWNCSETS